VSRELEFMFQTDLNRFWGAVTNEDDRQRISAAGGTLHDCALCEIVRYGVHNKSEMVAPLIQFYRRYIAQMPEEHCSALLTHVVGFIENTETVKANALFPFITEDARLKIASSAVIDYVSLGELVNNDPMSRVKEIIGMIEGDHVENVGAAFGALLHIGDGRVCQLIRPLRDTLDEAAVRDAMNCATGFIHSASVEFYLDWLEGMEGHYSDSVFGLVVSGLVLIKKGHRQIKGSICTGHRPFPIRGVTHEQWIEAQNPMALESYIERIAPRLYALERTEPPPRILPHVLTEWGLKPASSLTETAPLEWH
jgi:hypothetical protein